MTAGARGEVFDLGYRHYEGPREGRAAARRALWINGIRTALGLGRGARAKILPGLFAFALLITALILALLAANLDRLTGMALIPSHSDYYGIVSIPLAVFAAIIAPELLCPDRRDGTLSLYLVRPITPTDYVLGRWLAFFTLTLALLYLGQIFMLIGLTLGAAQPLTYLRENWLDIPRFLGAGFAVALFTTTLPMSVAAFTTRRAYAAAFTIGLYMVSSAFAAPLSQTLPEATGRWIALLTIGNAPIHLNDLIFNDTSSVTARDLARNVPAVFRVLWYSFLTAGPAFILWRRYARIHL